MRQRANDICEATDKGRLRRIVAGATCCVLHISDRHEAAVAPADETGQTLKRKWITSPSRTTYSLPSARILPADLQAASLPRPIKSSHQMTSALMKPRSKSVWILPAAPGALVPRWMVHARTSFLPAVKYVIKSSVA